MAKKEKKSSSKYEEKISVEIPTGFSFDDFVGAIANADKEKVENEVQLLEALQNLIEANERVIELLEKESKDGCKAQISWAKQLVKKLKSGL